MSTLTLNLQVTEPKCFLKNWKYLETAFLVSSNVNVFSSSVVCLLVLSSLWFYQSVTTLACTHCANHVNLSMLSNSIFPSFKNWKTVSSFTAPPTTPCSLPTDGNEHEQPQWCAGCQLCSADLCSCLSLSHNSPNLLHRPGTEMHPWHPGAGAVTDNHLGVHFVGF